MKNNLLTVGKVLALLAFASAGCEDWTRVEIDSSKPPSASAPEAEAGPEGPDVNDPVASLPPVQIGLPSNPQVPASTPGTKDQLWYFGYKSHDNTFRIRWPTYFFTVYGVGSGSYTLVNGQQANFRSYDTDGGAKRPSYSLPGPASRLSGRVTCILVARDGTPLAWFSTPGGTTSGTLP